jgi:hypothetical protein
MTEQTSDLEPLNPYAKTFFCLWGLVVVLLVGFRTGDSTSGEQPEQWHQQLPAPFHPAKTALLWQSGRVKKGNAITENGFQNGNQR